MTCPMLYRFRVIDKLPSPPTTATARGTLVHAVLERLFDLPATERTIEAAVALVPQEWERLAAEEPARHGILHEILRLEPVVGHLYRRTTRALVLEDGAERHEVPAGAESVDRSARDDLGHVVADKSDVRLVVADVGHQRLQLRPLDVGRVRDHEIPRPRRQALEKVLALERDRDVRA